MAHYDGLESICNGKLWEDGSLVNNSGVPNVSPCFRHTVLIFVPTIFFWILFPIFLAQIWRIRRKKFYPLPWSILLIAKLVTLLYLFVITIIMLGKSIHDKHGGRNVPDVYFMYPILLAATLAGMFFCMVLAKLHGMVTSGILHLTSVILAICGAPEFYACIQHAIYYKSESVGDFDYTRCSLYLAFYPLAVVLALLYCFADAQQKWLTEERIKQGRSTELESSFLNRVSLWWFNSLPILGARKDLVLDDLHQLNEGNTSAYLVGKWERLWGPAIRKYNEMKRAMKVKDVFAPHNGMTNGKAKSDNATEKPALKKEKDKELKPPSIVWRLFLMFKYEILTATITKAMSDALQFSAPFLLNQLIGFVSDKDARIWKGIAFSLAIFACSEIRSFLINHYFFLMFRAGCKIQTTLTGAVYKKTLRLSNEARRQKTVGEIVNLMAIDIDRFQQITPQIQQFWSCPFQITLALIYLFYTLGASAACGVAVMVLFLPLNIVASIIVKKWQMQQMKLKDERLKMCNEILNGMKVIKLYAWEPPMEETIEKLRKQELSLVRKASLVRAMADSFNTASPFFVALLTFITYTLSSKDHVLTPQIAFVSLTLFNQLRSPMTMIAFLIQQTVQALVANKRLKEFLVADELDINSVERSETLDGYDNAIEVRKASFAWERKDDGALPTIADVDFTVPKGHLAAVVGRVGCGKSSLLSALLGEMEKLRGYVGIRGRIAYVPQQPWIRNLSLRENITFGKTFDQKFYDRVIQACALIPDIAMLPQGDRTEIGEKGINLSGGQKARISLARAVYQNYDVYLMDDPLSAVDSHVGKHIFNEVIGPNGLLRNKTRILVTHGLTFLKETHMIALMEDGKIKELGSFHELMRRCGDFATLMEEYGEDSDSKSSSSGEEKYDDVEQVIEDPELPELEESVGAESAKAEFTKQVSTVSELANGLVRASKRRSRGSRTSSRTSSVMVDDKKRPSNSKLIITEKAETGRVKFNVYMQYFRSATYFMTLLFFCLFALFSALQLLRGVWLSKWADANDVVDDVQKNDTMSLSERLGIYAGLGVAESLSFFASLVFLVIGGLYASKNLHTPFLHNILRSPMAFFDTTPIGRILNRFGKDIDVIDQLLPINFRYFAMCICNVVSTLVIVIVSTPIFAAVIVPLSVIYYASLKFYVPTSRQIKRLESINRSPIYSHFGETIQGAASIRAFRKTDEFYLISEKHTDCFIRCTYPNLLSNRWLAVRLEFVGNCVVLFAALFATLSRVMGDGVTAGVAGLSISYALNITETLNFAVRQVSALETNVVSVERVKEYVDIPTEAEWRIAGSVQKKGWPNYGKILLNNYSTRYRPGLELVVQNLNAIISPGEKVGIVGRTGAGKSSLALALFRMIEPAEGTISIDEIDISSIGLHDLRSRLTIIPQDPVLFSGTLRFNLDPFHQYEDHEIWAAVELAHLKPLVASFSDGLDHIISEGGENISVGQRQLTCLARALLRRSKVLVLDEATAAVDLTTDSLIQETIRKEFMSSTILTIAHRLNTILDYDRVMVLDKGRIVEFDSPHNLLSNRDSIFHSMAVDAHITA